MASYGIESRCLKTSKEELEQLAVTNASVKRFIEGKNIQKIIVVPKRLVNIVAK